MEKELTRETVDPRYTWDLTRIYASDEAWEEAFADVKAQAEAFAKRAGTLSHGREAVLDALAAMMRMDETFFALHAYAMMKNNEDSTNAKYQAMSDRAGTLAGIVAAACSFMEPELLALEEGEIEKMIDISRVEGRVKASSLRKVGEIVDKHPEEAVSILRNWIYQESR